MASMLPSRAARTFSCSACRSFAAPRAIASPSTFSRRGLSTAPDEAPAADYTDKPRWSYTPPRAKAPFSLRTNSSRPEFPVNSDPKVLDQFYLNMLGKDGDKMLSEEVKWLAVTHKSFDQGRRGFNDRLAFLGKQIVQLQASLSLVQGPGASSQPVTPDPHGREPFRHPSLGGLTNLTFDKKNYMTRKSKLAEVAMTKYDLPKVLRWSPRIPDNLPLSGIDLVLAHTMYAIVGAISLEKGGHVANKVARERILAPLGFRVTA